ncbi:MAG TPA: hypothetical protein VN238_08285 [Solirubrobacteraceae bacterium]|nr:hypothetical protein [Solirubrobacteraceae bacterium]
MTFGTGDAIELMIALHAHKTVGYGDAWRKRGELLSMFTNLARKYDRLVVALDEGVTSGDERLHDTAADLCVYAGKYLSWLAEQHPQAFDAVSRSVAAADAADVRNPKALPNVLRALEVGEARAVAETWARLKAAFTPLDDGLVRQATNPSVAPLAWEEKVRLAWGICTSSAALLIALSDADPDGGKAWRDEVQRLGTPPRQ